jgi:hypothetical protein
MPHKNTVERQKYKRKWKAKRKAAGLTPYDPAIARRHYMKHREQKIAYSRKYKIAHKDLCRGKAIKYNRTLRGRFGLLRREATSRKHLFTITFDQWVELVKAEKCGYCGKPLPPAGGGIDRKNSKLGYILENCAPCCKSCNEIRGHDNISYDEMFEVMALLNRIRGVN